MNRFFKIFLLSIVLLNQGIGSALSANKIPSWYLSPRQNNSDKLFGVAEGFTQEEATKNALADLAGRLVVTISAESQLIKESNNNSSNEELRQKVKQSIEKISFSGFELTKNEEFEKKFYAEVAVDREKFINEQKERVEFIQKKITDLDKSSSSTNPIQRRVSLLKIMDLCKELELKARILIGAKDNVDLKKILNLIANYQNELEKSTSSVEFVFDSSSPKDLVQIIRSALNKENLKIAKSPNKSSQNQITIEASYNVVKNFIYGAHMAKLNINIENSIQDKVLASNNIEVSGSSSISHEEALKSALVNLEQKIQEQGILKILGIVN